MGDIRIAQAHTLTLASARDAGQKLADKLAAKFGMQSEWNGNVLKFDGSGVSGTLDVTGGEALLEISLGFMLMAFAPKIEEEVARSMRKAFADGTAI
jgi:putative polyhydroxyalkanoate system protein